jgi:hypothetical protein
MHAQENVALVSCSVERHDIIDLFSAVEVRRPFERIIAYLLFETWRCVAERMRLVHINGLCVHFAWERHFAASFQTIIG